MIVNKFRVLSLGVKKRKAWNKTGKNICPIRRKQTKFSGNRQGIILQSRGMVRRILGQ